MAGRCWKTWRHYWRTAVLLLAPLILLPLVVYRTSRESRCGYVVLLMAVYWLAEPIPLPVTALLPVVLFPLLSVISTDQACYPYLQETNMLFIGNLIVAIAIENCNLHRRVALRVLIFVGTDPRWLMLGFMLTTMFLSMWICNSATTAMMMPIIDAVVAEINLGDETDDEDIKTIPQTDVLVSLPVKTPDPNDSNALNSSGQNGSPLPSAVMKPSFSIAHDRLSEKRRKALYLSVAYAANIGGTATLTSAGPNLVLKFFNEELYDGKPEVDYATWFVFSVFGVVVSVLMTWGAFILLYIQCRPFSSKPKSQDRAHSVIKRKYEELGGMTFQEGTVLTLFIALVTLWMFRDPHFAQGWATYFGSIKPKDATAVMAIVTLLFILPANPRSPHPQEPLLSWETVQRKLPWGVVLLRGGGFAMAEATKASGLSPWMGHQLASLRFMSIQGLTVIVALLTSFLTEFVSNSATAMILIPVMAELATSLHVNPLFLMVPTTLACSYAFMLPVGTPANAIVFGHAHLNTQDMLLPGFIVKMLSLVVMLCSVYSLGVVIFGLNQFPRWALMYSDLELPDNVTLSPSFSYTANLTWTSEE